MSEKEKPVISVIVPIYNSEKFLEATVRSIQAQTYEPLEIVLVNDGSTDDSKELCDKIAKEDSRIIVVDKENGGLSSARNAGTAACHGFLVGYVDSDDLIYPDMYENLYNGYLEACRIRGENDKPFFVMIGREEIDESGNRLPDAVPGVPEAKFIDSEEYQESLLLYTGDVSFCTRLVRRDFMLKHPFEEGVLAEDFSLQMKLIDEISGIYLLPLKGYRVVHRVGSMTRRSNPSQFSKVYISIVEHADYVERLAENGHESLATAAKRFGLFERLDYLLHVPISDMNKSNDFYVSVVAYIRKNYFAMLKNPYLTGKNKVYLTLFAAAPALTRKVHWKLRGKSILKQYDNTK